MTTARLPRVRRPARWRILRNWRRVDWNAVCLELLLADWSQVDGATDVNSCVEQFMAVWNAIVDRHCPPRRARVSRPSCPWLEDPGLRALMSERDSAHDTWLCLRTPEARAEFVAAEPTQESANRGQAAVPVRRADFGRSRGLLVDLQEVRHGLPGAGWWHSSLGPGWRRGEGRRTKPLLRGRWTAHFSQLAGGRHRGPGGPQAAYCVFNRIPIHTCHSPGTVPIYQEDERVAVDWP